MGTAQFVINKMMPVWLVVCGILGYVAPAFISTAIFLLYITSTCSWALSSVAVPQNLTASVGAMQNFGGYLGGALAPTVTGLIVQHTGSFVLALVVGAAVALVSAASYLFIVRDPISAAEIDQIDHALIAQPAAGKL